MKNLRIKMLTLVVLILVCVLSLAGCYGKKEGKADNTGETDSAKPATLEMKQMTEETAGEFEAFTEFKEFEDEGYQKVLIMTDNAVKDVKFVNIQDQGLAAFEREDNVLYSFDELTPEKPFMVTWMEWGTMPHRGLSFVDANNETRFFYLHMSGEDGSLLITEYD
jgi:hypothetical protein